MLDRGICPFSDKVRRAQDKGAIAVIICNIVGAGGDGEEISGGMIFDERKGKAYFLLNNNFPCRHFFSLTRNLIEINTWA